MFVIVFGITFFLQCLGLLMHVVLIHLTHENMELLINAGRKEHLPTKRMGKSVKLLGSLFNLHSGILPLINAQLH